jgi:hypothetical protein
MTWEWPEGTRRRTQQLIPAMLWALHHGGPAHSPRGHANGVLYERMLSMGAPEAWLVGDQRIATAARELEDGRYGKVIHRETRGKPKRVFTLSLLPPFNDPANLPPDPYVALARDERPKGADKLDALMRGEELTEEDVDRAVVDVAVGAALGAVNGPHLQEVREVQATANGLPPEPLDFVDRLLMIQRLANEVLIDLVTVAANAPAMPDDGSRLAVALDENQRLRRKLADATESAVAHKREAEAVRRAAKQTQANLDALLSQSRTDDSGFKALRKMMEEKPVNGRPVRTVEGVN